MRFRKLRIAWSVGWGIACVLLIVLWVRSYWWVDMLSASHAETTCSRFDSRQGRVAFLRNDHRIMTIAAC